MKIVVFDTETTGLPDSNLDELHWDQPWVIQLGAVVLEDWDIVERLNTIIRVPDMVLFQPEAVSLHGISPEVCLNQGKPIEQVLDTFAHMCKGADIISTYNFMFDSRIMRTCNTRLGRTKPLWSPDTYEHCIMLQAQDYFMERCTLKQCYRRFFKKPLQDAHDAFADTIAATEIFRLMTSELTMT